jgi:hypothetical protein
MSNLNLSMAKHSNAADANLYVEPIYIRKLAEVTRSHKHAGDLIGCTPSHYGAMIRGTSPASKSYELAARLVFIERYAPTVEQGLYVVSGPKDKVERFMGFIADQSDIKVVRVP